MEWFYGQGEYREGLKHLRGTIVRDDSKLFLRESAGEIVATFIPLEKIERIKKIYNGVEISVRLSVISRYRVRFQGDRGEIARLIRDLTQKLDLKKKFLRNEWEADSFSF